MEKKSVSASVIKDLGKVFLITSAVDELFSIVNFNPLLNL